MFVKRQVIFESDNQTFNVNSLFCNKKQKQFYYNAFKWNQVGIVFRKSLYLL